MRVVATAGHVDHGKSSLVLALTGTDPDRFAEEKARGLTIDLGFAFTTLPSGTEVGFVDVPGHVRFLKNMLAGVGAVDMVLFVVSAREGWMPQSEEHLVILELLGVRHGLVVLTNSDTIEAEELDTARLAVGDRLSRSSLAQAPIVACDSVSGRGLDDVRAALDAVLQSAPPAADLDRPRLWVDRVFAPRGAGTVVTGTLVGGAVAVGDVLEVGGTGTRVRVRGIETAHRRAEHAAPATRVALNLTGVERSALARGDALVRPGQWTATTIVDVAVTPAPGEQLPGRARLQAYVGSGEHEVSVQSLDPSGEFARLRFATPIPLAPGDRIVLRDAGRGCTVAGAQVLDVEPSAATAVPRRLVQADRGAAPRRLRARPGRRRAPLTGLSAAAARALAAAMVDSGLAVLAGDSLVDVAPERVARARSRTGARERRRRPRDLGQSPRRGHRRPQSDVGGRRTARGGTRDRARRRAGADRRVARGRRARRRARRRPSRPNLRPWEPTRRSSVRSSAAARSSTSPESSSRCRPSTARANWCANT